MSDSETYLYRYSWDKEDLQTCPWTRHYTYQPENIDYLRHVVKKHDWRKHMSFETEMKQAWWDDESQRWTIQCRSNDVQKTLCAHRVTVNLSFSNSSK